MGGKNSIIWNTNRKVGQGFYTKTSRFMNDVRVIRHNVSAHFCIQIICKSPELRRLNTSDFVIDRKNRSRTKDYQ